MNFRLAVVGHRSSVKEISEIISEKFENIETTGIELASDEMTAEAVEILKVQLPRLDGVLYTRNEPYQLVVSRLNHAGVLARYVNVDAASFVHSLLNASLKYGADIRRVSVDTLDYRTIMKTYRSLGVSTDDIHPIMVNVDTKAEHFVEATAQAHRKSYQNGLCSVCITNIRNVQDKLDAEGIPCVLMFPSPDNYINEIRRMILLWEAESKHNEATTIIRLRAELANNDFWGKKATMQSVLDFGKLAESVALFAQLVAGAFIRTGEQDFIIVCNYESLSSITEKFTHLNLLAQVYTSTPFCLAIGIGTGINFQIALANAEAGMHRAKTEGGNRAYLINADNQIVGPIQPNELLHKQPMRIDLELSKVARDCALSFNTVQKIDTFIRRKNNGSFITSELAQELHVSFRTAARIVEKLEANSYIVEIGRNTISARGRPTRIFSPLW